MSNVIKVKRYSLEANVPTTGLNPGEFILAVDTGILFICWTASVRIRLGAYGDLTAYLRKDDNLAALTDKAAARANLGVYSIAEISNLFSGLNWKADALCVTLSNIALTGLQTIDGITVVAGARVGVVAQTTATENGIYIASVGAWTRTTDADSSVELLGATFGVAQGSTQADTVWRVFSDDITIGSTAIDIQPFTGIKNIVAGFGLTILGNTIDVALEELGTNATYSSSDYLIMIDVSAAGTARQTRMLVSDFLAGTGIVSDTYQVKINVGGAAGFLTDKIDIVAAKGLKKTLSGDKVMLEQDVASMVAMVDSVDATGDQISIYNASTTMMEKTNAQKIVENVTLDGGIY